MCQIRDNNGNHDHQKKWYTKLTKTEEKRSQGKPSGKSNFFRLIQYELHSFIFFILPDECSQCCLCMALSIAL